MFSKVCAASVAATLLVSGQAMAWGDMYMGDGTHNPNSPQPQAYHGPNYCPAGLQPVVLGGVVCCGHVPMAKYKPRKKIHKAKVIEHQSVIYTREQIYSTRKVIVKGY